MSNKIEYDELIAFHPGYYVKGLIEEMGITQEELAKRMQATPKYISDLVNGRINLTDEMVLKLSIVFGTSTGLWLNLNQKYIEKKLEIERRESMDAECEIARALDYSFWVRLGLVNETRSAVEKVCELQRYFKVASLSVLREKDFLVQYRTSVSEVKDINVISANAWVQTAINLGAEQETAAFDRKKLRAVLPEILSMSTQDPETFRSGLKTLLADCGVALVLLPNLRNCGVNGAVKWLGKDKAVLALNDRKKYGDAFRYSRFHELGHVFQHRIKVLNISGDYASELRANETMARLEAEADAFAREAMSMQKK